MLERLGFFLIIYMEDKRGKSVYFPLLKKRKILRFYIFSTTKKWKSNSNASPFFFMS